jgi:cytochrome c oxidase subunit II
MRYVEIASGIIGTLLVTWSIADAGSASAASQAARPVKEIAVVAERFKFTPDRIEVNQGDHVRLTVRSADGTHGLAIKKLKLDLEVPKGGAPAVLEFDATTPGEYQISCSEYCGRGHSHMKAVLVVNPQTSPQAGH